MKAELLLFAKTPVAGRVKTRLIPELGEQGAADFAAALIDEAVRHGTSAWPGPVRLLAWPEARHPCFERIQHRYGIDVGLQQGGDLGARMLNALEEARRRGRAGAVMGCDVPLCPIETYRTAHAFVAQGRSVIGPSTDGGYYFIAVNPPHPECFERIEWGGSEVFDTTLRRAADHGVDLIVLQQLNDIDTVSDVEELRAADPALADRLIRGKQPG